MLYLKIISQILTKENCLGLGDVKLFTIGAAWLGFKSITIAIAIAFITAGLFSFFNKVFIFTKEYNAIPFAPFISFSIINVWILSEDWWIQSWMDLWGL